MKSILIVEDEWNLRLLYSQEFKSEGYEVVAVPDGASAREQVRQRKFDLAIVDVKLDGESGLDVLREIMSEDRQLRVILNSAYSSFMSDFTSWSADAYLVKSSDLSELKSKVKELTATAAFAAVA
jgi:DNA-binding response OmpR family regulator